MGFKRLILMHVTIGGLLLSWHFPVDARISPTAVQHIKQRHWHQANSGTTTSHFNRSMTVKKLDAIAGKAIRLGSVRRSAHGQGRLTHQYRFQKSIGTGTNGKRAYSVRVVSDGKGNVITAFPVN